MERRPIGHLIATTKSQLKNRHLSREAIGFLNLACVFSVAGALRGSYYGMHNYDNLVTDKALKVLINCGVN